MLKGRKTENGESQLLKKRLKTENHNSKTKEAENGEPQLQNKRGNTIGKNNFWRV